MFNELIKYQMSIYNSKLERISKVREEISSLNSELVDLKKNPILNAFNKARRDEILNLSSRIDSLSKELSKLEMEKDEDLKNSNPETIYKKLFGGDINKIMSFMEEKGIPLIYGEGSWSPKREEDSRKEPYHSLSEVCLVRMTGEPPKDDKIEPSFYSEFRKVGEDYHGHITVHFTLNGVVSPHSSGAWDDRKYSIIQPMDEEIMNRLDVFSGVDSFSQGTFEIKKGYIICPQSEMKFIQESNPNSRVIGYDPEKTSAYNITNDFISSLGYTVESQVEGRSVYNQYGVDRFKELTEKYQKINCLFGDSWQARFKGNKICDEITEKNLNYYLNMISDQNESPTDVYNKIIIDVKNRDFKVSTTTPMPPALNVSSIYLSHIVQTILEKKVDGDDFSKTSELIFNGGLNLDEMLPLSKKISESSDKFDDLYSENDGFSNEELFDMCQKSLLLDFDRSDTGKKDILDMIKDDRFEMKFLISKYVNKHQNLLNYVEILKTIIPFYTNNYPGEDINLYLRENLNGELLYWINENVKLIATPENYQAFKLSNFPDHVEVPNFNLPYTYRSDDVQVAQMNPEYVKSKDVVNQVYLPVLFSQRVYAAGISIQNNPLEEGVQQHSV